ncbi:MAG: DUF3471 domain-containing protein, partial [Flavobacterium sp.]
YKSLFKAYGLGWQLQDINGFLQVSHTGGLDGIVTQIIMIPEKKLGIIVLTNQQSGAAFTAISNTIKDSYLGLKNPDHIEMLSSDRRQKEDNADKITDEVWAAVAKKLTEKGDFHLEKFVGTYKDNWLGEANIYQKKGKLLFASKRSPRLAGEIFPYNGLQFVVKWNERSFGADAFLFFKINEKGEIEGFKMKAISPLTDFSYDFHDLAFWKVTPPPAN